MMHYHDLLEYWIATQGAQLDADSLHLAETSSLSIIQSLLTHKMLIKYYGKSNIVKRFLFCADLQQIKIHFKTSKKNLN